MSVHIQEQQGLLIATVTTDGLDNQPPGQRELTAERAECRELISSLALALAIAIDPRALAGPLPPPPPPAPPPASHLQFALGVLGTYRGEPGGGGLLGLRRRALWGDLGLEASLTVDRPRTPHQGTIRTTFLQGDLLACTSGPLHLCASLGLGALRITSSGYNRAQQGWLGQVTLGPRLEWEPTRRLRVHLEAPLALQKTRLLLGNEVIGDLPSTGFRAGISFFWGSP